MPKHTPEIVISVVVKEQDWPVMPVAIKRALTLMHVPAKAASNRQCHAVVCLYRFPELLRQLDDSRQRLGVVSYGLAVTTLEEVFLKVSLQQGGSDSSSNHQVWGMLSDFVGSSLPPCFRLLLCSLAQTRATPNGMSSVDSVMLMPLMIQSCLFLCLVILPRPMQRIATPDAHLAHTPLDASELPSPCLLCLQAAPQEACAAPAAVQGSAPAEPPLRGPTLYLQQLQALFMKRLLTAKRDRMAVVTQLLVPIALVLAALWAGRASSGFPQEPALAISRCKRPTCSEWGWSSRPSARPRRMHLSLNVQQSLRS